MAEHFAKVNEQWYNCFKNIWWNIILFEIEFHKAVDKEATCQGAMAYATITHSSFIDVQNVLLVLYIVYIVLHQYVNLHMYIIYANVDTVYHQNVAFYHYKIIAIN